MLLALSGPWSKTIWHLISKVWSFLFGSNALGIGWVFRTTKPIELFTTIPNAAVNQVPDCLMLSLVHFSPGQTLPLGRSPGWPGRHGELVTDNI